MQAKIRSVVSGHKKTTRIGEHMKDEKFYEVLRKSVISSLSYLREKSKKEKMEPVLEYDMKIDMNEKKWGLTLKPRYPLEVFVIKNLKEILELPDMVSCLEFMIKNDFHKKIGIKINKDNNEEYKDIVGHYIIGGFLRRYAEKENKLEYDQNIFDELYSELEEYLYTEYREIIAIAPLLNFKLKGIEEIDLGKYMIRKMTEDEIKILLGQGILGEHYFPYPEGGFFDTIWCVELKINLPKEDISEDLRPYIDKFITILRLFKKGAVQYSGLFKYPKVWRDSWSILYSSEKKMGIRSPIYELTRKEVKNFKNFWNLLKNLNIGNYPFLDVAIRRFNFSYDKDLPEDKLIDFIIAFEALYLKGAGEELSYRLALRGAYFLGKDEKEREDIFKNLRNAYIARSKIVHGESTQSKSFNKFLDKSNLKSLKELSIIVEEYLRESIKIFLGYLRFKSHDEILKEIDEKIIRGKNAK